ncbi:hypothetical protein EDB38_10549 [Vibrio crassostreae]|nr:hypothetical protein EDB30_102147 [Vibrio crassostreae]TCT52267.1 hypothetical protein EDB42_105209 [Vibrio crassostreae]TCT68758.1 hypothetical protein EDB31_11190 [Vibrio crassostreae]TCT76971.1 hypothetical protein EDB41_105209 [Vibrio crassostreae]TCT95741.1 hypothetical protein EDB38_10549 [Vibrio crassostreae]
MNEKAETSLMSRLFYCLAVVVIELTVYELFYDSTYQ